jgi:hypothetical protein
VQELHAAPLTVDAEAREVLGATSDVKLVRFVLVHAEANHTATITQLEWPKLTHRTGVHGWV